MKNRNLKANFLDILLHGTGDVSGYSRISLEFSVYCFQARGESVCKCVYRSTKIVLSLPDFQHFIQIRYNPEHGKSGYAVEIAQ